MVTEPKKIKCHNCTYVWDYKGKRLRATCPNCGLNVDIKKHEVKQ